MGAEVRASFAQKLASFSKGNGNRKIYLGISVLCASVLAIQTILASENYSFAEIEIGERKASIPYCSWSEKSFSKMVDGTFEVTSSSMSCQFFYAIQNSIRVAREKYPRVESLARIHEGRKFRFSFGEGQEKNMFAGRRKKDGEWVYMFNATTMKLRVTWMDQGGNEKFWTHFMPVVLYINPGNRKIPRFPLRDLAPLADALIESFFVEMNATLPSDEPQHNNLRVSTEAGQMELDERIYLKVHHQKPYMPMERLLAERVEKDMRDFFSRPENALPDEVAQLNIQVRRTILRPKHLEGLDQTIIINRRSPSETDSMKSAGRPVLAFRIEAYDQADRRLVWSLWAGAPRTIVGAKPLPASKALVCGMQDTLFWPYDEDLFDAVGLRVLRSLKFALKHHVQLTDTRRFPLRPYELGPTPGIKSDAFPEPHGPEPVFHPPFGGSSAGFKLYNVWMSPRNFK